MAGYPEDLYDEVGFDTDAGGGEPIRRSRAVRWTAILVIASFAFAGLASLFGL